MCLNLSLDYNNVFSFVILAARGPLGCSCTSWQLWHGSLWFRLKSPSLLCRKFVGRRTPDSHSVRSWPPSIGRRRWSFREHNWRTHAPGARFECNWNVAPCPPSCPTDKIWNWWLSASATDRPAASSSAPIYCSADKWNKPRRLDRNRIWNRLDQLVPGIPMSPISRLDGDSCETVFARS